MQSNCLEKYVNLISHLDPLYFSKASQAFFLSSMRSKDFPMTGDSILRNFGDYRKKMRSVIIPALGSTFVTMKSGKDFMGLAPTSLLLSTVVTAPRVLRRSRESSGLRQSKCSLPLIGSTRRSRGFASCVSRFFASTYSLHPMLLLS